MESPGHTIPKIELKELLPTAASIKDLLLDITIHAIEDLSPDIRSMSLCFATNPSALKERMYPNKKIAPMWSELLESNPPPWSSLVNPSEKRLDLVVDSSRIGFGKEVCLLEDIVRGLSHEIAEYRVITEEEYASRWNFFPPSVRTVNHRLRGWMALQCALRDRLADMLLAQYGFERVLFTGANWDGWAKSIAKGFSSKEYQDQPVSAFFLLTMIVDRSISLQLAGLNDLAEKYAAYMKQSLLSVGPKERLSSFWEDYCMIRNSMLRSNFEIINVFELLKTYKLPLSII